jgi:23S rRNA (guanosine2251-2'-O)-methyltransferase
MELVYGLHAVDALLRQQPEQVQYLWVQDARRDKRIAGIVELARNQGVALKRLTREQLDDKVQGRHQGVVAEVRPGEHKWDEAALNQLLDSLDQPALLLVLDGVTDPHNLGACLRSADAAGVHAVIVPKDKAADLTPTVRKVACGAAEVMPFVRVTNLARTLDSLKERGIWLFGTADEADKSIYNNDLTGPMALLMGSEGAGLRRLTREACDYLVKLPMAGSVSSLNISVAAGICLFEVVRQRRQ